MSTVIDLGDDQDGAESSVSGRKLNYLKCHACRQAKKKCLPENRQWPERCRRCVDLKLDCSPPEKSDRQRQQSEPISISDAPGPGLSDDESSRPADRNTSLRGWYTVRPETPWHPLGSNSNRAKGLPLGPLLQPHPIGPHAVLLPPRRDQTQPRRVQQPSDVLKSLPSRRLGHVEPGRDNRTSVHSVLPTELESRPMLKFDDPGLGDLEVFQFNTLSPGRKQTRLLRLMASGLYNPEIECELFEVEYDTNNRPRLLQDRVAPVISDRESPGTKLQSLVDHIRDNHGFNVLGPIIQYEAFSWCWTEEPTQYAVTIRKGSRRYKYGVKRGLALALRRLRLQTSDRILWVDAICINHQNAEEHSGQVSMITTIFTQATRVCVWLGDQDKDSVIAIRFIQNEIMKLGGFDAIISSESNAQKWQALLSLMQRPWFTRRWVVQEIALAPTATIYCGQDSLDWKEFTVAVEMFVEVETATHRLSEIMQKDARFYHVPGWFDYVSELGASLLVAATGKIFRNAILPPQEDKRNQLAVSSEPTILRPNEGTHHESRRASRQSLLSLEHLVCSFVIFKVSNPQDAVYSLLSVARDAYPVVKSFQCPYKLSVEGLFASTFGNILSKKPFVVDYSRPYVDFCKDFVRFCIERAVESDSSSALDILCRPWAFEDKVDPTSESAANDAKSYRSKRLRHSLFAPGDIRRLRIDDEAEVGSRSTTQYWREVMREQDLDAKFKERWDKYLRAAGSLPQEPGTPQNYLSSSSTPHQEMLGKEMALPSWVASVSNAPFALFGHPGMHIMKVGRKSANPLVGLPEVSHNYAACQSRPVDLSRLKFRKRPSLGHCSLYVRGFILDEIEEVCDYSQNGAIPSTWLELAGWKDPLVTEPPDEFWRTLVADRGRDNSNPPAYYARACRESIQKGGIMAGAVDTSGLIHNERNSMIAEFCRRVQSVIWNRALIKTRRGALGLVSRRVKSGDLICILYGCSVPVILRRSPKKLPQEIKDEEFEDGVEALKACIVKCEDACLRRARYKIAISEAPYPDLYQAEISEETAAINAYLASQRAQEKEMARRQELERQQREQRQNQKRKRTEEFQRREREKRRGPASVRDVDVEISASRAEQEVQTSESMRIQSKEDDDKWYSYKFLGESYIHGMMDGEAITRFFAENLTERVFELR